MAMKTIPLLAKDKGCWIDMIYPEGGKWYVCVAWGSELYEVDGTMMELTIGYNKVFDGKSLPETYSRVRKFLDAMPDKEMP